MLLVVYGSTTVSFSFISLFYSLLIPVRSSVSTFLDPLRSFLLLPPCSVFFPSCFNYISDFTSPFSFIPVVPLLASSFCILLLPFCRSLLLFSFRAFSPFRLLPNAVRNEGWPLDRPQRVSQVIAKISFPSPRARSLHFDGGPSFSI